MNAIAKHPPGRVPPHDLDAEAAILSALLLEPNERVPEMAPLLGDGTCFYSPANRRVFEAITSLAAVGTPIDVVTVASWLKKQERLAEIGGVPYLARICDAAPAVAHVEAYARTVLRTSRQRTAIQLGQRMAAEGYGDVGDLDQWIGGYSEQLHELSARGAVSTTCAPFGQVMKSGIRKLEERQRTGLLEPSLPTGILDLDEKLLLSPGDVCVIAGRPGMGKSALAFGIMVHVADQSLWTQEQIDAWPGEVPACLGFSMEMPKEQIAMRALCGRAEVNLAQMRRGAIGPTEWQRLMERGPELVRIPAWLDDKPGITLDYVRSRIRSVRREAERVIYEDGTRQRLRLVVIDYLQLMARAVGKNITPSQAIGEISRGLKTIAKEEEVACLLLSQLNRSVEARPDKRPLMSDLRESGEIEQDADQIVFTYRDEVYNPESRYKGIGELLIAKQRNGASGRALTRWEGVYTRFSDLTPSELAEREAELREIKALPAPRGRRGLL